MKQIIAIGGLIPKADYSMIERYIVEQSGRSHPKVCFLPTASGDTERDIQEFTHDFTALGAKTTAISLFRPDVVDIEEVVLDQDIVYVGSGNTRSMMALWREWGLDRILRRAWDGGIMLAGVSSGAICWFEQGLSNTVPGDLRVRQCLGFLKGSFCPHYRVETNRRPAYHHAIASRAAQSGVGLDDGAALHFIGDRLERVVSPLPDLKAYHVYAEAGAVHETPLDTVVL